MIQSKNIFKKVLPNGLTILVKPNHHIPKVSTQLWYNVGSKDEKSGEKGLAHFIEHMIFKGTKELSESDINLITHKLSGYCNAFTSYDYTGYLFDLPSNHWQECLPIMADCMQNCTFKQDLLNSELKAVIQELKMYKDDYASSLVEEMICAMFQGHPYQHPIIGYKHDLWTLTRENLVAFYKKHYVPNNATLVVVGDVQPEEVFKLAQKYFDSIPAAVNYKKETFNVNRDFSNKSVTLLRDVAQPIVALSWMVPGSQENLDYEIDVLSWIIAEGRSSRLFKKLVNDLELVTDISSFSYDLIDQGIFFIHFTPKQNDDIEKIISIIKEEIDDLIKNGPTENEVLRAAKKVQTGFLSLLENNQKQAYMIGKSFMCNGDEEYVFNYIKNDNTQVLKNINEILKKWLNPSLVNIGKVLPIESEQDKQLWNEFQKASDELDNKVLEGKTRELTVEPGVKVHEINIAKSKDFAFPKPQSFKLKNGLEVLYYNKSDLPKIELILDFKAKHYYDPQHLQGVGNFVSNMLYEGTSKYNANELAHELEFNGISFNSYPGYITMGMLKNDFNKSLNLLNDIVTSSSFKTNSIEKVRKHIISDIKEFWDEPSSFISQIAREQIYEAHHYSKNALGNLETINRISQQDLLNHYKQIISPKGATLVIVGDLEGLDIQPVLEDTLGNWQGPEIQELNYCQLAPMSSKSITHYINRDQVVLGYAGLSITRDNPDYDKLLIFDQIFCGGVLGSMSSRLFQLREQFGLFYTIGGSLISKSDTQPGMSFIKTIVSNDKLAQAESLIEKAIDSAADTLTNEEFEQAKNALSNSLVDNFATNKQIANSFLFVKKFNFGNDFFDKRASQLQNVKLNEIKPAVEKILKTNQMIKVKIGRV